MTRRAGRELERAPPFCALALRAHGRLRTQPAPNLLASSSPRPTWSSPVLADLGRPCEAEGRPSTWGRTQRLPQLSVSSAPSSNTIRPPMLHTGEAGGEPCRPMVQSRRGATPIGAVHRGRRVSGSVDALRARTLKRRSRSTEPPPPGTQAHLSSSISPATTCQLPHEPPISRSEQLAAHSAPPAGGGSPTVADTRQPRRRSARAAGARANHRLHCSAPGG